MTALINISRCFRLAATFGLMAASLLVAETVEPAKNLSAMFTGPGSCSSPSCHGGVQPRQDTSVLQNEYSTWVLKDKHTKAYEALTNPIGQRMGKILGLPHPETAPKCLTCHSLDVPLAQRARSFDKNDGVSCENCHGPASTYTRNQAREITQHTWSNDTYQWAGVLGNAINTAPKTTPPTA